MRKFFLSTGFILISFGIARGTAHAQNSYPVVTNSASFTYENLVETIKTKSVHSIEDVLPLLPSDLRENYVLVYHSRSLQDASFAAPRAILFGNDAKLMMAFNGQSTQAGFNSLELIQFRDSTAKFEFREILFSPNQPPIFSDPNPSKCLRCHQASTRTDIDPRPNWEPYDTWPGVFGGDDGAVGGQDFDSSRTQTLNAVAGDPALTKIIQESDNESASLKVFLNRALSDPRYKFLTPYNNSAFDGIQALHKPLDLTARLGPLNFQRVARLASEVPQYEKYKYVLWASSKCDQSVDKLMPLPLYNFHIKNVLGNDIVQDGTQAADVVAHTIRTVFEPLGVDTSDWSMDFRTQGRLAFTSRFGVPDASADSEWITALNNRDPSLTNLSCDQASTSSLDTLRAISVPQVAPTLQPPLINQCMNCHVGADRVAPAIPFDNLQELAAALNKTGFEHGKLIDEVNFRLSNGAPVGEQMPPSAEVSAKQKQALLQYLMSLGSPHG